MPHILFVHGMNVEFRSREDFERKWFEALTSKLRAAFPDAAERLPTAADCSLVYWSDLIPPYEEWAGRTKGIADDLEAMAAEGVRALFRTLAEHVSFDARAVKDWNEGVRKRLEQSVLYMDNVMELQERVLERFQQLLRPDTCLVIGHSLGSVIAYQGLLRFLHAVDALITIGSPLGTPNLIYERLAPHEWPNVKRWYNFSATVDVWSVPTPKLDGLFRGPIRDVTVRHGTLHDLGTHRLDRYLGHREILVEIERAWREASTRP